jgi:hypothetical protein
VREWVVTVQHREMDSDRGREEGDVGLGCCVITS